ncbi:hypothetical protein [Bradyrhizobium guangdongense]
MFALHKNFENEIMPVAHPLDLAVRTSTMGEAAAPDVPAAVGWMILGVYALIMSSFLLLFARDMEAGLMVAVSGVYFTVYLGVPAVFFRTEARSGNIDLKRFLRDGLQTWTGHVGGFEAIVQILMIPVALTVAITAIGIISIALS